MNDGPRQPVVVCGAGAAGMAAAIAAARCGAEVRLIEALPAIGGTVAGALIHTLGGLYDSRGEVLNGGLPRELIDRLSRGDSSVRPRRMGRVWVLSVCPNVYRRVVEEWIAEEPRITLHTSTTVSKIRCERGNERSPAFSKKPGFSSSATHEMNRVIELEATEPAGTLRLGPHAVIDTTGTADVVRLMDPTLVIDDPQRSAGGLIFRMRGVPPGALEFPRGLAVVRSLRGAAADGLLPATCRHAWIDTGIHADEVFVKLMVPLPAVPHASDAADAHDVQSQVVAFLRTLSEFADAEVTQTGRLGVRDGGRVRGEYYLTAADVRAGRRFADAAGRGSWPIEYWDPVEGVSLEHLPDGRDYDIPLRSLKLAGLGNVWAAGKCLSADRLAHASARVAGTCWAMGEAAGRAAAS
ncbi:MAG: FAD-dependent oxidoreductase [Planctomycetaceae bacterium]